MSPYHGYGITAEARELVKEANRLYKANGNKQTPEEILLRQRAYALDQSFAWQQKGGKP